MRFLDAAAAATEATSAELIRIKHDRDLPPAGAVVLHYDWGLQGQAGRAGVEIDGGVARSSDLAHKARTVAATRW